MYIIVQNLVKAVAVKYANLFYKKTFALMYIYDCTKFEWVKTQMGEFLFPLTVWYYHKLKITN